MIDILTIKLERLDAFRRWSVSKERRIPIELAGNDLGKVGALLHHAYLEMRRELDEEVERSEVKRTEGGEV